MTSNILTLIFFIAFCIYSIFGIYGLLFDMKSMKNRIFFVLCMSLCLWSLALAVINSSTNNEDFLFWHSAVVFGRSFMHALLLHFILYLTDNSKFLKKSWSILILYLPAILTFITLFIGNIKIHMQNTIAVNSFEWLTFSSNDLGKYLYIAYYSAYTIISIVLINHWRSSLNKKARTAANLLIITFFFAFIVSSLTDIILVNLVNNPLPELAPVIILVPVAALYYGIKRHNLIRSITPNSSVWSEVSIKEQAISVLQRQFKFRDENDLLSNSNKLTVMLMFPILFIFSIVNFGYFTMLSIQDFSLVLINSLIILGLSYCFMFTNIIKNTRVKYRFITMLFVLLQIFLHIAYYDYIGPAVWTASFIYIMLALYQTDATMLKVFALTVFGLGIYTWIRKEVFVLNLTYYVAQFVLFAILFLIASLVHNMNFKKSARIKEQMKQQELISEFSKSFLNVNDLNFEDKVTSLLEQSGKLCEVDRSYLFLFSEDSKTIKYSFEWCSTGIKSVKDDLEKTPVDAFSWWNSEIQNGNEIYIPDIEKLSGEAIAGKELLTKHGVKSLLSMPVTNNKKSLGFLGFNTVNNIRQWSEDDFKILRVIATILSDALIKLTAEKEIRRLAYYDDLTGIPNRRLLINRINNEIIISKPSNKIFGIVFIDLDYFKNINDTMGHKSGDELLKQISFRLSESIKMRDTVCRFGGDEYLLLLTNLNQSEDILYVVNKIMESFDNPFLIERQEFYVSISAGIAIYPRDGEDPETLIKNADLAMYSSKNQGRNRYTLCSSLLKEEVLLKTKLTHNLYRAQQNNELQLYYQPQISISTKKIVGVEALLRWNHPLMGIVMPGVFIPLAEQTGLINPIGEWAIRTACSQCAAWHKLGITNMRMAVNLSLIQIQNPNIINTLRNIIEDTGLNSEYLEFEITESIACKSNDNVIRVLNELKKLGAMISIDDFGVEYSSLNRLKRLPIDRIKVDMQFIHSIDQSDKDDAIVKIIVQLGKNLGLHVIAEGVETESQLNFLETHLCDEVQGYYFFKPMPLHEIENILLNQ